MQETLCCSMMLTDLVLLAICKPVGSRSLTPAPESKPQGELYVETNRVSGGSSVTASYFARRLWVAPAGPVQSWRHQSQEASKAPTALKKGTALGSRSTQLPTRPQSAPQASTGFFSPVRSSVRTTAADCRQSRASFVPAESDSEPGLLGASPRLSGPECGSTALRRGAPVRDPARTLSPPRAPSFQHADPADPRPRAQRSAPKRCGGPPRSFANPRDLSPFASESASPINAPGCRRSPRPLVFHRR